MTIIARFSIILAFLIFLPGSFEGGRVSGPDQAEAGRKTLAVTLCAGSSKCRATVAKAGRKGIDALKDKVADRIDGLFPEIKVGANSGPTSGKRFGDKVKQLADNENPTKTCVFCRRPGTATQKDHSIPKSKGGNATIENAQLACPPCNQSKGNGQLPKSRPKGYTGEWPPTHFAEYLKRIGSKK